MRPPHCCAARRQASRTNIESVNRSFAACLFISQILFRPLPAQTGAQILLVGNKNSAESRQIVDYYRLRRPVPASNVCWLSSTTDEEVEWNVYQSSVEAPIADCLKKDGLQEKVLYIVTTLGVPLRVDGTNGPSGTRAAVDSELTLLYSKLKGAPFNREGKARNPFFGQRDAPFRHPQFPLYMVTRLAGYDVTDVKAMIDRGLQARNRGTFVIDGGPGNAGGNAWLSTAALLLPPSRVKMDMTTTPLYGIQDVIGYAAWGSNDGSRKRRWLGFQWLPGAIATEFVSSNGRTFKRPPENWNISSGVEFAGSEQSLSADLIHEGATGVSGNVYEPYLDACPRPEYVLPAYFDGRNLAESFYMGIAYLSWMEIVLGDPLCSLGKP